MLKPMRWMIIPSMLSVSTIAFAGGFQPSEAIGSDSSAASKASAAQISAEVSKAAKAAKAAKGRVPNTTNSAKKIAKNLTANAGKAQQTPANKNSRSPIGFRAVEDEQLVIDTSQLRDGDGLGTV